MVSFDDFKASFAALEAKGYRLVHPDEVTEEMDHAARKVLLEQWGAEPPPFQGANFALAAAIRAGRKFGEAK
jgi:hypothetical protein